MTFEKTQELTRAQALALLEKAVESRGADTVVDSCSIYDYDSVVRTKLPSCIVGQAIFELVGAKRFQQVDDGTVLGPLKSVRVYPDEQATLILVAAQTLQDGGLRWGDVVQQVKAEFPGAL